MSGNELAPPLSLWEKIKTGVTGFVKSALNYLPSGLMFAGLIMGGSALLGAATGMPDLDFAHVVSTFSDKGLAGLAGKAAITLALGSAISGGMGAWNSVKHATQEREALRAHQVASLQRGRSHAPERQHDIAYEGPLSPQAGLPNKAEHLHTALHTLAH